MSVEFLTNGGASGPGGERYQPLQLVHFAQALCPAPCPSSSMLPAGEAQLLEGGTTAPGAAVASRAKQ